MLRKSAKKSVSEVALACPLVTDSREVGTRATLGLLSRFFIRERQFAENGRKWKNKTENDARTRGARAPVSSSSRERSNHLDQLNNFLVTLRDRQGGVETGPEHLDTQHRQQQYQQRRRQYPPTTNSPALKITPRHDNVRCLCRVSSLSLVLGFFLKDPLA